VPRQRQQHQQQAMVQRWLRARDRIRVSVIDAMAAVVGAISFILIISDDGRGVRYRGCTINPHCDPSLPRPRGIQGHKRRGLQNVGLESLIRQVPRGVQRDRPSSFPQGRGAPFIDALVARRCK
jgi:hypothetical protein